MAVKTLHSHDISESASVRQVVQCLTQLSGIDFSLYKSQTLKRRLEHRYHLSECLSFESYCQFLLDTPHEQKTLLVDCFPGSNEFFKDPAAYAVFEQEFVPALFEQAGNEGVRVWNVGCAEGHEVYSVASVLKKYQMAHCPDVPFNCFATDISETVLSTARTAQYSVQALKRLPETYREYFVALDAQRVYITDDLKEHILFAEHDVFTDPPLQDMDMVICRNMRMYFTPSAQGILTDTFTHALKPGGILFLGAGEHLGKHVHHYRMCNEQWRLFVRHESTAPHPRPKEPSTEEVLKETIETTMSDVPASDELKFEGNVHALNEELARVNRELQSKISAVKEAKKQEAFHKERFDLAIRGMNDGIWDWPNINEDEAWWSSRFYELIGYTEEECPASKTAFYTLVHPDDHQVLIDAVSHHYEDQEPYQIELRIQTKAEGYRWYLCKGQAIWDQSGQPTRMVGSISDIHARKDAEKELQNAYNFYHLIIESAMAGYWDWHIDENREIYSPHFLATLGYEAHEVPQDPTWWTQHVHPDDLPVALETYQNHIDKGGREPFHTEVRYFRKDGSMIWVYCKGCVMEWGEDGTPKRVVGTHIDITPLKEVEARLARKNKELEMFAYVTTHDLREPIVNLGGLLNIFRRRGFVTKANNDLFSKVETSIKRIDQTLHDLIDVACLRRSKGGVIQTIRFKAIMSEVLDALSDQIRESGATIRTDFRQVRLIHYLPGHVKSILQNLMSNAMKYRDSFRPLNITIKTSRIKSFVVISVSDNGIGLDAEKYGQKVFDVFKRFNVEVEGKGIGLYIVKSQAEYLGGYIEMESEPGEGSVFRIFLPDHMKSGQTIQELANGRVNVE